MSLGPGQRQSVSPSISPSTSTRSNISSSMSPSTSTESIKSTESIGSVKSNSLNNMSHFIDSMSKILFIITPLISDILPIKSDIIPPCYYNARNNTPDAFDHNKIYTSYINDMMSYENIIDFLNEKVTNEFKKNTHTIDELINDNTIYNIELFKKLINEMTFTDILKEKLLNIMYYIREIRIILLSTSIISTYFSSTGKVILYNIYNIDKLKEIYYCANFRNIEHIYRSYIDNIVIIIQYHYLCNLYKNKSVTPHTLSTIGTFKRDIANCGLCPTYIDKTLCDNKNNDCIDYCINPGISYNSKKCTDKDKPLFNKRNLQSLPNCFLEYLKKYSEYFKLKNRDLSLYIDISRLIINQIQEFNNKLRTNYKQNNFNIELFVSNMYIIIQYRKQQDLIKVLDENTDLINRYKGDIGEYNDIYDKMNTFLKDNEIYENNSIIYKKLKKIVEIFNYRKEKARAQVSATANTQTIYNSVNELGLKGGKRRTRISKRKSKRISKRKSKCTSKRNSKLTSKRKYKRKSKRNYK